MHGIIFAKAREMQYAENGNNNGKYISQPGYHTNIVTCLHAQNITFFALIPKKTKFLLSCLHG